MKCFLKIRRFDNSIHRTVKGMHDWFYQINCCRERQFKDCLEFLNFELVLDFSGIQIKIHLFEFYSTL